MVEQIGEGVRMNFGWSDDRDMIIMNSAFGSFVTNTMRA